MRVYVCVSTCLYVYMYVYMCIWAYICVCASVYICSYVYVCVCLHVRTGLFNFGMATGLEEWKKKSEYKPVKVGLKIDLVSHPSRRVGFGIIRVYVRVRVCVCVWKSTALKM